MDFSNDFKLLLLKGYDVIMGCDWIKKHNPIGLDLRDDSRLLVIQKNGKKKVFFMASPTPHPNHTSRYHSWRKFVEVRFMGIECHSDKYAP
jgi:hypothetical protein